MVSESTTELASAHVVNTVLTNMDNGFKTIAIFTDLSKAFDTINHEILIVKLKHYGLTDSALNLIKSCLTNRKQFVSFTGMKSYYCTIRTGVPQGFILSPLLFLIYINDLARTSTSFESVLYADDGTFLLTPN